MNFFSSFGGSSFGGSGFSGHDDSDGTNDNMQIEKKLTTLHSIKRLEFPKKQVKIRLKSPIESSL